MAAGVYNIPLIEQGASYALECIYRDSLGDPIVLTDFIGRGQIKVSATSVEPVATFDVTIIEPPLGRVLIELTAEQSALIPARGASYSILTSYIYDIELVNTVTDEVIRLLNGTVQVSPEVTK